MPFFNGDIRDYSRFKSDFTRQVVPEVQNDYTAAYALKSCLGIVRLDIIRNVDDDLAEMWRRLDDEFGKASKLTDVIMKDIKKMRPVKDNDDKYFLELINTIERGFRDLSRMKIEHEMSNSIAVSLIEEKLPKTIRREWARKVNKTGSKVSDKNKFPSLLEFLLEQKRIIQYDSTGAAAHHIDVLDINDTSDNKLKIEQQKCVIHGTTSHFTSDCKSFLALNPDEKIKVVKENKLCYSCLRTGH